MRKLFLISIVLSFVCATYAQTEFSVPTPTMEEKYSLAKNFMYNTMLVSINVAKSEGITVEKYAKKCGEIFAPYWDADLSFEQFANIVLSHRARLSEDVQIIEQSDEKIVFVSSPIYPQLENQGVLIGTSLEELVTYFDIVYGEIAKHLNFNCNMELVEGGMKVEISQ